jgi:hypothetical protein
MILLFALTTTFTFKDQWSLKQIRQAHGSVNLHSCTLWILTLETTFTEQKILHLLSEG